MQAAPTSAPRHTLRLQLFIVAVIMPVAPLVLPAMHAAASLTGARATGPWLARSERQGMVH